jgi:polysaccharide biosynthesis protein EpsC
MTEFVRRRQLGDRVIIYGAGSGGSLAVRQLVERDRPARVLGFVDDDQATHRARVHGYPVLGGYDALIALIEGGAIDQIVISTRLFDRQRLKTLETLCAVHNVRMFQLHVQLESIGAVS